MPLCPTCERPLPAPAKRLARQLDAVGADWTVVRTGACRSYVYKLRYAYPAFEWRATKETLDVSEYAQWQIEARRAA